MDCRWVSILESWKLVLDPTLLYEESMLFILDRDMLEFFLFS
jgi:hypothetical protein